MTKSKKAKARQRQQRASLYMSEENIMLEMGEDLRLKSIGINPHCSEMEISKQIEEKLAAREYERANKKS